jgi:cell division protein FtsB
MISDLQGKVIAEGEGAHKIYSEFAEFCEDRARDLGFEIKSGKAAVAELTATIEEQDATIGSLTAKVEDLAASIATDEKDLKAATEVRAKEQADFAAEEKELVEVIDTLGRAVAILEREMQAGASMLQLKNAKDVVSALTIIVQASAFNAADASRITALVQNAQSSDDEDAGAPDAAVYESQSGGIVATLQGLQDKAEGQLSDARKKETSALHNFEMLKQSLEDAIRFANDDMAESKKGLAEAGEKKAMAEGDLEVTTKDLKADEEALAELHRDCMSKAEDYEAETKSRGEELAALAKAKQVIEDATGGAEKIAYGFEQSFLQRSSTDVARFEAVRYVRDLARKHQSPQLAQLASRMSSAMRSADPFAKVTGLISDMIARLEAEAEADATEKAYCDKEMSETEAKKADKDAVIEKLSTQIDQKTAKSAHLKEQVAALQNDLANIAKAQAEMDKLREEEHTAYVSNKADMEQGLEGVKLALKVLQDYYSQDDKAHGAADGASSGIIGLLEVCESDFSKDLAEIVTTEETAAAEYERQTKENEVETAAKTQDVKYKTQESVSLDKAVAEATSDRSGVQEELDAVLEYLDKLKERCVAKAETYEDRKAARDAEIAGLKQAAEILDGQAALLQTKRSFLRRKSKLDINQKVYIENAPVLGDGQGDAALNTCRAFTAAHVSNPDAPEVKVCGTGIKATVFLRGRCEGYYEHSVTVGKCDSGAPPSTCDVYSPADKAAFGHYQSYLIEQC